VNAYTLTANKGEWSELYVLFKLFSENKIKAADMNLQPTDDEYTFLKIFREDVLYIRPRARWYGAYFNEKWTIS